MARSSAAVRRPPAPPEPSLPPPAGALARRGREAHCDARAGLDAETTELGRLDGDAVQEIMQEVYQTPKAIAAAVADMVNR